MEKVIQKLITVIAIITIIVFVSYNYYSYTSDLIVKNASHQLLEVYSNASQTFEQNMHDGWSFMRNWANYLISADDDQQQNFIQRAKDTFGFTDFYFVDYAGNYCTVSHQSGTLDIEDQLIDLFVNQSNISA